MQPASASHGHVEIVNPDSKRPVLILCDHAGRRVPPGLERLGISEEALAQHIGWDIGAADLSRRLAARLDAPAVLDHCSRLVIDPNRRPGSPTSIPEVSDGCLIPGNHGLTPEAMAERVGRHFLPYHRSIARRIGRLRRAGLVPVIISLHSFTPRMNGEDRPWQIGVLSRHDTRLSAPCLNALRARGDLVVGDNQPYSGLGEFGFTIEFHAQRTRLPHVMFEIRQDEIATRTDAERYADIIADVLAGPLADPALYVPYAGPAAEEPGQGRISWRFGSRL